MLKKALSDSPSAILKTLYDSRMTKVSTVKWFQIYIFFARSHVSGIPQNV